MYDHIKQPSKRKRIDPQRLRESIAYCRFIAGAAEDFHVWPGVNGGVDIEAVGACLPEAVQGGEGLWLQVAECRARGKATSSCNF